MKITKLLHPGDTMTAEERLQAAINLQVPDRVPVSPMIYYFAATYAGITNFELYDTKKYNPAMERVFFDLGPWDALCFLNAYYPEIDACIIPMRVKEPGRDLPPDSIRQFLEEEVMREEDYAWIVEASKKTPNLAYNRLLMKWIPRIWDQVGDGWRAYAYMVPRLVNNFVEWKMEFVRWNRRGAAMAYSFLAEAPFDDFSMARGLLAFAKDLRKYPREIAEAADALVEGYISSTKTMAALLGVRRVLFAVHRSSNDFISPDTFKKLSFPSLKRMVEGCVAAGINPILHCDGNWDLNLETLRELPAGNVVVQFDGASDIFKAKEVIGDRICISGDVPADLLALGSPSEVDEYCHRLIEEVGKGGGFILGTGCELAPNAKPENVKAMFESVVKYGYYQ
jgi:Uroporphyrinogen decarboxylase (URO-D)